MTSGLFPWDSAAFLPLGFPNFMSACGFGFIRIKAAITSLVFSMSESDEEPAISDFQSLSPHMRTLAFVGQFLQMWASIEIGIQYVIGEALEIKPISLSILCANMRFRDKTNIIRTLVDVSDHAFDATQRDHFKKVMRDLGEYSTTRNMIAHDPFLATEDGFGMQFLTVKAKGNYARPEVIWGPNEFREAFKKLHEFSNELEKLEDIFKDHPMTEKDARSALAFITSLGLGGKSAEQANERPPSHPPQADPGSHPTSPETPLAFPISFGSEGKITQYAGRGLQVGHVAAQLIIIYHVLALLLST